MIKDTKIIELLSKIHKNMLKYYLFFADSQK